MRVLTKRQETMIGIVVAAILVGYFVYQVAYGQIPEHTTRDYTYGYSDGRYQADSDAHCGTQIICHGNICPSGHTQQYCMGYKQGYKDQMTSDITA